MKSMVCGAMICTVLSFGQIASAATVGVYGDRFDLGVINDFYDNLPGHTSSIIGSLTDQVLGSIDLLWAVQPDAAYTASEVSAMKNLLDAGGRIAFMGEHGSFAPTENNNISAALAQLGSTMSIINLVFDGGYQDATIQDGQILSHPLLQGVDTYNYAAFAPLNLGANGIALMRGSEDPTTIMMGFENVGKGSIFLITDQNVWDNVGSPNNDNARMFENLLSGNVANPNNPDPNPSPVPVPLPAAGWLLLAGLGGLAAARRRKLA